MGSGPYNSPWGARGHFRARPPGHPLTPCGGKPS
eukprot:gene21937-biopygen10209